MTETLRLSDKAVSHYRIALEYIRTGRVFAAHRQLKIAEEFGFDKQTCMLHHARIAYLSGRINRALALVSELQETGDPSVDVSLLFGKILQTMNRQKESVEQFKDAFKKAPSRYLRIEALFKLFSVNRIDDQKKEKLMKIAGSGTVAAVDTYPFRRTEALIQEMKGDYRGAFLGYRSLSRDFRGYVEPLQDIARVSFQQQNYGLAVSALNRFLRKLDSFPDVLFLMADIFFRMKKYGQSCAVLKKIAGGQMCSSAVFLNMAHCKVLSGNLISAIRLFKKAIALDPDNSAAHFGLATVYHQNGSLDTAEESYRQAFIADCADYRIMYNLGNLLYEGGDYNSSVRAFQHCLKLNPGFKSAANNLKFVMMAKVCYPEDGPESDTKQRVGMYWIGFASVAAIILLSIFQGWL